MNPHEARVLIEREELVKKYNALQLFFDTNVFKSLSMQDKKDLSEQAIHMSRYLAVLDRRIARFPA